MMKNKYQNPTPLNSSAVSEEKDHDLFAFISTPSFNNKQIAFESLFKKLTKDSRVPSK